LASTQGLGVSSPFQKQHDHYVLVEGKGAGLESWLETCFEDSLVAEGVQPKSSEEARNFWRVRESIAEFLGEKGVNHSNDISLPVYNLKGFIDEWTLRFSEAHPNWELYVFGHIGDGNLHLHAIKPNQMPLDQFLAATQKVDETLFGLVQKFGGSISAEHGIGLLKKKHLHYSKSKEELEILKSIKLVLDPKWLLNPGKIID
jgi:FAD/FMN-containing dehydrogenase